MWSLNGRDKKQQKFAQMETECELKTNRWKSVALMQQLQHAIEQSLADLELNANENIFKTNISIT